MSLSPPDQQENDVASIVAARPTPGGPLGRCGRRRECRRGRDHGAIPAIALGVVAVAVGPATASAAQHRGVPALHRRRQRLGPGGLVFGAVAVIVAPDVHRQLVEQVSGAAVICGLRGGAARGARRTPRRRASGAATDGTRGRTDHARHTDRRRCTPRGRQPGAPRRPRRRRSPPGRAALRAPGWLSTSSSASRRRAGRSRPLGLGLGLIAQHQPAPSAHRHRHRAVIGRQMIAWSTGRYLEVECAAAHCVMRRRWMLSGTTTTPVTTTSSSMSMSHPTADGSPPAGTAPLTRGARRAAAAAAASALQAWHRTRPGR